MFKISDIERLEKLPSEFDFLAEVDGNIKRISNKNSNSIKIIIGIDEIIGDLWFIKGVPFDSIKEALLYPDKVIELKCNIIRRSNDDKILIYPALIAYDSENNMICFAYKDKYGSNYGSGGNLFGYNEEGLFPLD